MPADVTQKQAQSETIENLTAWQTAIESEQGPIQLSRSKSIGAEKGKRISLSSFLSYLLLCLVFFGGHAAFFETRSIVGGRTTGGNRKGSTASPVELN